MRACYPLIATLGLGLTSMAYGGPASPASAIGKAGGGDSDGYFLLVFEKTSLGWKIIRDDSTALPRPGACATGH